MARAQRAVGEIGDPTALPALEQIANGDVDPALRDVAKVAVQRIRARPVPTEVPPSLVDDRRPPAPGGPQ